MPHHVVMSLTFSPRQHREAVKAPALKAAIQAHRPVAVPKDPADFQHIAVRLKPNTHLPLLCKALREENRLLDTDGFIQFHLYDERFQIRNKISTAHGRQNLLSSGFGISHPARHARPSAHNTVLSPAPLAAHIRLRRSRP